MIKRLNERDEYLSNYKGEPCWAVLKWTQRDLPFVLCVFRNKNDAEDYVYNLFPNNTDLHVVKTELF